MYFWGYPKNGELQSFAAVLLGLSTRPTEPAVLAPHPWLEDSTGLIEEGPKLGGSWI